MVKWNDFVLGSYPYLKYQIKYQIEHVCRPLQQQQQQKFKDVEISQNIYPISLILG